MHEVVAETARGPFSLSQFDRMFGHGRWQPLRRCGVVQSQDGKVPTTDYALQSFHNAGTLVMEEAAIFLMSFVFAFFEKSGSLFR